MKMAFLEMRYYSEALRRRIAFNVLLPEMPKKDKGAGLPNVESYKTLYLFHGLSGDCSDWIRKSGIELYAEKYGIAVVMPSVERSWYTDTQYGEKYFTFVTEELPGVCRSYFRNMSDKREDNFVAGLSMGGYGAIKAALSCPEKFGGCASLSGGLDIVEIGKYLDIQAWRALFDYELKSREELGGTEHDLFELARRIKASGKELPRMFLWCGTEDYLIELNRKFHKTLEELELPHVYRESEGNHSWKWWDMHIQDALEFFFK